MKTDAAFCSTGEGQVRRIMENRRAHGECAAGEGGCEVMVGASCGGARGWGKGSGVGRVWRRRMGKAGRVEGSLVMWVVGLLVMSLVVNFHFMTKWYNQ